MTIIIAQECLRKSKDCTVGVKIPILRRVDVIIDFLLYEL
jgi:hypothetical protein